MVLVKREEGQPTSVGDEDVLARHTLSGSASIIKGTIDSDGLMIAVIMTVSIDYSNRLNKVVI